MPKLSPKRSAGPVREKQKSPRLLADDNTSHQFVSACRRLACDFPVIHIARWQDGSWLGLNDVTLLISGAEAGLALVAYDRATLPWHAGQVVRAGDSHGGHILFRRSVQSTDYGDQARLVTDFWLREGRGWDWTNRMVYLPKSP